MYEELTKARNELKIIQTRAFEENQQLAQQIANAKYGHNVVCACVHVLSACVVCACVLSACVCPCIHAYACVWI